MRMQSHRRCARELNHCLTGEAAEVAGGLIAQCLREGRDFPVGLGPAPTVPGGGTGSEGIPGSLTPHAGHLERVGQGSLPRQRPNQRLCLALEVQLEPTKMEYYSVCTLICSDEQNSYKSALEAHPELISQSTLWELQSSHNTAGYLA